MDRLGDFGGASKQANKARPAFGITPSHVRTSFRDFFFRLSVGLPLLVWLLTRPSLDRLILP